MKLPLVTNDATASSALHHHLFLHLVLSVLLHVGIVPHMCWKAKLKSVVRRWNYVRDEASQPLQSAWHYRHSFAALGQTPTTGLEHMSLFIRGGFTGFAWAQRMPGMTWNSLFLLRVDFRFYNDQTSTTFYWTSILHRAQNGLLKRFVLFKCNSCL